MEISEFIVVNCKIYKAILSKQATHVKRKVSSSMPPEEGENWFILEA